MSNSEDVVTIDLNKLITVFLHEEQLLLICGDPQTTDDLLEGEIEIRKIDKNIFNLLFPNIVYINSKFGFMAIDKQHMLPLNIDDTKFMTAVGVTQDMLDRVKAQMNEETGYIKLIRDAGLIREHCIIFADQILFHSPNIGEFETYRCGINPHISVSEYHPIELASDTV